MKEIALERAQKLAEEVVKRLWPASLAKGRGWHLAASGDGLFNEKGERVTGLGTIIKQRRKARQWTLRQLSAESGVSVSHLGHIERETRSPSGHVLRKLARPLGFEEVELFKLAGFLSDNC